MTAAVLIIDMQKDFFLKDYKDQAYSKVVERTVVANTNRLLAAARLAGLPVIHSITRYKADRSDWTLRMKDINYEVCIEGTPGVELVEGMEVLDGERVVPKTRYSAFFRTGLDDLLRSLGVDTLITCGINAHACIRSTVIDAFMSDYRVFLPVDCIGGYDPAHKDITLHYFSNRIACLLSLEEMLARLERGDLSFRFG